jgi:hypothetical protein
MFRLGLPLNGFIRLFFYQFAAAEVVMRLFYNRLYRNSHEKTAQSWFPKGKEQAKTS